MKPLLVLIFAVAICAGLLFLQHHRYEALFQRQEQAIALVQSKYDTLFREQQIAKQANSKRLLGRQALAKARALAPRYAALNQITGYTKKTAQK